MNNKRWWCYLYSFNRKAAGYFSSNIRFYKSFLHGHTSWLCHPPVWSCIEAPCPLHLWLWPRDRQSILCSALHPPRWRNDCISSILLPHLLTLSLSHSNSVIWSGLGLNSRFLSHSLVAFVSPSPSLVSFSKASLQVSLQANKPKSFYTFFGQYATQIWYPVQCEQHIFSILNWATFTWPLSSWIRYRPGHIFAMWPQHEPQSRSAFVQILLWLESLSEYKHRRHLRLRWSVERRWT